MKNSKTPFLCGGIFFFLISGIKQGVSAREHAKGIKDEVKNEDIMDDLILAIVGRRYSPNKAEVSQYRSCSANGTSGIPFDDKSVRDSLSDAIANNYIAPHKRITTFLDKYMVGEQQRTWFVKALLDIILHDETIAEDECFYIREVVEELEMLIGGESIDVVVGGPPCQGFSMANRQRLIDDPRNYLYKNYIEVVRRLQPKFFVMENVKGMLGVARQVKEDFEAVG